MDIFLQYIFAYPYVALFLAAVIEGPAVAIFSGSLIATNHLELLPVFSIFVARDIILDSTMYYVGRFLIGRPWIARKIHRMRAKKKIGKEMISAIERGWKERPVQLMWIAKFAYGIAGFFIISAGMVRIPYSKFLLYVLPVTFFQFSVLLTIGYVLGNSISPQASLWIYALQLGVVILIVYTLLRWLLRHVLNRYL